MSRIKMRGRWKRVTDNENRLFWYDAVHCKFAVFQAGRKLPYISQFAATVTLALTESTAAFHQRMLPAALVTLVFALIAYRIRSVTLGGAASGAVISFVLYVAGGPGTFIALAVVFALTAGTTRLRYMYKLRLVVAERKRGRNAWQVLANLSVAAIAVLTMLAPQVRAVLFGANLGSLHDERVLFVVLAALAEAAADTVSSEIGQAFSGTAYLITSFRRVRVGIDGGISLIGTLAGMAAALLVVVAGLWSGPLPRDLVAPITGAAVLGSFFDSLLGATLQRRGWLNNSAVNLISTAAAAGIALAFLI
jgi:uncharacterized protein (TIGR00297 family)